MTFPPGLHDLSNIVILCSCRLYARDKPVIPAPIIAIFIFLPPSPIIAIFFGITFGFLWLSTVPPTMGLVGFIFGTKYIGLLYGIVFLSHQIGSFFGAYLGGVFHDLYGSYDYAWYISIALSIFAGLIHLPIIEKQVKRLQTI